MRTTGVYKITEHHWPEATRSVHAFLSNTSTQWELWKFERYWFWFPQWEYIWWFSCSYWSDVPSLYTSNEPLHFEFGYGRPFLTEFKTKFQRLQPRIQRWRGEEILWRLFKLVSIRSTFTSIAYARASGRTNVRATPETQQSILPEKQENPEEDSDNDDVQMGMSIFNLFTI